VIGFDDVRERLCGSQPWRLGAAREWAVLVIPDEAKASSAAMSAWIDSKRDTERRRRGRKAAYKPTGSSAPQSAGPTKRSRKRKAGADADPSAPAQPNSIAGTPLRIPYGNIDEAWCPIRLGGMVCASRS
jgi:hypothetical protein